MTPFFLSFILSLFRPSLACPLSLSVALLSKFQPAGQISPAVVIKVFISTLTPSSGGREFLREAAPSVCSRSLRVLADLQRRREPPWRVFEVEPRLPAEGRAAEDPLVFGLGCFTSCCQRCTEEGRGRGRGRGARLRFTLLRLCSAQDGDGGGGAAPQREGGPGIGGGGGPAALRGAR